MSGAGRNCPVRYRYRPAALRGPVEPVEETVYVVGGLYGNVEALETILGLAARERRHGLRVTLVFNGDFHWFDTDPEDFARINEAVLAHRATLGNVEAELARPGEDVGCGCAYPDYVDDGTVARSNRIMEALQATAARWPEARQALAALPMHRTVRLGGRTVGIVHGDAESLAGWAFAAEALPPPDDDLRETLGCTQTPGTDHARLRRHFVAADVDVFACAHTCLPALRCYRVQGRRVAVVNNGAAGMPNFRDAPCGVITRLSTRPEPPPAQRLYGTRLGALRIDALAVRYDHEAWLARFTRQWPPGSPAHASYVRRLTAGPPYLLAQAAPSGTTET